MCGICAQCACPLDNHSVHLIGVLLFCDACFSMWEAICENQHFVKAQTEYIAELERRRKILNGD